MMKAADGKVYVPYTLGVPGRRDAVRAGVGLRARGAQGRAAARRPRTRRDSRFTFEDFYSVEPRIAAGQPAGSCAPLPRRRASTTSISAIRPKAADPKKAKDEPGARARVQARSATLPNFWNGELTTSTVVVTSKVETVQGQVAPESQRERPYLFGQTEFVPSPDNKFKKTDELSVVFQIYNPALDAGQAERARSSTPSTRSQAEGEKYFNKTNAAAAERADAAAELRRGGHADAARGPVGAARRRSRRATTGWKSRSPTMWPRRPSRGTCCLHVAWRP